MAFPYRGVNNKKTRKAPKGNGKMGKFPKKKASPRHILGVLAALFWLAALILGGQYSPHPSPPSDASRN